MIKQNNSCFISTGQIPRRLRRGCLFVMDDISLEFPKTLEMNFHPESEQAEQSGNAFILQGKQAALRLELLTNDAV